MTLEDAVNNATSAVGMRQTPSGRWEYYGPRSGYQTKQTNANPNGLMTKRGMIALEMLGLKSGGGYWYAAKNEMGRRFHRAREPRPNDLAELVTDTLVFLKNKGLDLMPKE